MYRPVLTKILFPSQIERDSKLYISFTDGTFLYYKRTFRGSRIICRSTVTGRFLNHSITKVAIKYSTTNKFQIEVYV